MQDAFDQLGKLARESTECEPVGKAWIGPKNALAPTTSPSNFQNSLRLSFQSLFELLAFAMSSEFYT